MDDRRVIEKNGFGLSMTTGSSMRPLIWGGEHCVAVVPIDGTLKPGDLLMFRQAVGGSEINVVHRLVEIREDEGGTGPLYITRGDNNFGTETVRREEITGRVVEVHRIGRRRLLHAIKAEKFTVTDPAYLRYVRVWTALWPLRQLYYRIRDRICRAIGHKSNPGRD